MPIAKLSIDMEARLANIEKDMARVSRISASVDGLSPASSA